MKKILGVALFISCILFLGIMSIGMFAGSFAQNKEKIYEMRELRKENRELKAENDPEVIIGNGDINGNYRVDVKISNNNILYGDFS